MKSVRVRSFSGPYIPAFGLNTERYPYSVRLREKKDQKNSEYGNFSRSDNFLSKLVKNVFDTAITKQLHSKLHKLNKLTKKHSQQ